MRKILLLLVLAVATLNVATGQVKVPMLNLTVVDSLKGSSLPYAHVSLVSGKDTIKLATDLQGNLSYFDHLADSVKVIVSYIGYETKEVPTKIPDILYVRLAEKEYDISEIVVKGDIIAVVTRGDTVQFNAAGFKTMDGDMMSRLFQKLPGMKLEDGVLTYMGEPIDRVTVDNQRLFGENVMLALENIRADDVENVKVYKQAGDFDQLNGVKNGRQLTVADVTTKSKPKMVRNVILSAGAGFQTESEDRQTLYQASGSYVASRVGETLEAKANTQNTPPKFSFIRVGHQYRELGGELNYTHYPSNKHIITTRNSFSRKWNTFQSGSEQEYFPTQDVKSRSYKSDKRSNQRITDFASSNRWRYTFRDKSMTETNLNLTYAENITRSRDIISAMQDDRQTQSQDISQRDRNRSYGLQLRVGYHKRFTPKFLIRPTAAANISRNKGDGWRVDTLASSSTQIFLDNTSRGHNLNIMGTMAGDISITEFSQITIEDEVAYIDTKSKRTALDMLTGQTDTENTFDYRIHELNNSLSAYYVYRNNDRSKGVSLAEMRFVWKNRNMQRDEYFPGDYEFPRTFNILRISSSLKYNFSAFNKLTFSFDRRDDLQFNILDLRAALDNTNPVLLRAGNPDLKIPVSNSVSVDGSFRKNAFTFQFTARFGFDENTIADKVRYFAEETFLPEYDYTAPAGSSLITKENLDGKRKVWLSTSYSVMLSKLRSTLSLDLSYSYDRRPAFVDLKRVYVTTDTYTAQIGFTGNFSTSFEPKLTARTDYSDIFTGTHRLKDFSQTVGLTLRGIIAKKVEIESQNDFTWNWQQPDMPGVDRFGYVANLTLGYRFTDGLTAKAAGFDLFNQRNRIFSGVYDDHISRSYTKRLGRYVMFSVEWKF